MINDEILKQVTDYYLNSRDFNGLPIRVFKLPLAELKEKLSELIRDGDISLVFEEQHPNPHVKCLKPWDKERQILHLQEKKDITYVVAYPEGPKLLKTVKPQKYIGKPYRLIVARGKPSLDCAFFKLDVLEKFRNDPRYFYKMNDIVGAIYNYDVKDLGKNNNIYIKSVDFAYDKNMNRAVCIFYTDLMDLNKDQQLYWKHYEVKGSYRPHPDFIMSQVYGQWPEKASLQEAFTGELKTINEITMDAYGKKLFKDDYWEENRPKELAFLIKPTAKEFENFIHILDKLISENINLKFFRGLVVPTIENSREDGKIVVITKGSLQMLEEYIRGWFKPKYTKPMDDLFVTFKNVRKLRQKPAHVIQKDDFNMKYFKKQRQLLIDAYTALRSLRLILQNHPKADKKKIPDWLYKRNIWTY